MKYCSTIMTFVGFSTNLLLFYIAWMTGTLWLIVHCEQGAVDAFYKVPPPHLSHTPFWDLDLDDPALDDVYGFFHRPGHQKHRTSKDNDDQLPAPEPQQCGIRGGNQRHRIVGGAEARSGEFPWQVMQSQTFPSGVSVCGGSLISDEWVLTAGHCLRNEIGEDVVQLVISVGAHNITQPALIEGRLDVPSRDWRLHPDFRKNSRYENDIGIIRIFSIKGKVANFMPICLPTADIRDERVHAIVAGWGRNATDGPTTSVLMYINTTTLRLRTCQRDWATQKVEVTDKMVCIDPAKGKNTICTGDSGGPLVKEVKGVYHVIGVASFGPTRCEDRSVPSVFTRVKSYLDFICEEASICPEKSSGVKTNFSFQVPFLAWMMCFHWSCCVSAWVLPSLLSTLCLFSSWSHRIQRKSDH